MNGNIPWNVVNEYATEYELDPENRRTLRSVILRIDSLMRERSDNETESKRRKETARQKRDSRRYTHTG